MSRAPHIANLLLLVAALVGMGGGAALIYAEGGEGWSDLAAGMTLLLLKRPALLVGLGIAVLLGALVSVGLAVVSRRRARAQAGGGPPPVAERAERQQTQRALQRARRQLEGELGRRHPRVEQVLDALLALLVDHRLHGLRLVPGPMTAEIELQLQADEEPMAFGSLAQPFYRQLLAQLRTMTRLEQDRGNALLDFCSAGHTQSLLVRLDPQQHGTQVRLRPVGAEEPPAAGRRRHQSSVVFRLEPQRRLADVITGEIRLPTVQAHDATDPGSAVLTGTGPSGENEVMPLLRRRRRREVNATEAAVRLFTGVAALLLTTSLFWDAFGWARLRAGGQPHRPWRAVRIQVSSTPVTGEVLLGGRPLGPTPLTLQRDCKGRQLSVLVRAKGYATWQWSGICPQSGALRLRAHLQPRK